MSAVSESPNIKRAAKILLSGIVDYAGLFPPSQATMAEAVANFFAYMKGPHSWILGRFVSPLARLDELLEQIKQNGGAASDRPFRISALASEDLSETFRTIKLFNSANTPDVVCDMLEIRANTVSKVQNALAAAPEGLVMYFEVPIAENLTDLIAAIAAGGQRAKIRTGGITAAEFPTSAHIIRFVRACTAAGVPFKATAGLHHPMKCFRPLSYAAGAPEGTMHGFMNVLAMTGFLCENFRDSFLEEIMEEEFEEAFTVRDNGLVWRGEHYLGLSQLEQLRAQGMNSFGSCSFDEPVQDLTAMRLI